MKQGTESLLVIVSEGYTCWPIVRSGERQYPLPGTCKPTSVPVLLRPNAHHPNGSPALTTWHSEPNATARTLSYLSEIFMCRAPPQAAKPASPRPTRVETAPLWGKLRRAP